MLTGNLWLRQLVHIFISKITYQNYVNWCRWIKTTLKHKFVFKKILAITHFLITSELKWKQNLCCMLKMSSASTLRWSAFPSISNTIVCCLKFEILLLRLSLLLLHLPLPLLLILHQFKSLLTSLNRNKSNLEWYHQHGKSKTWIKDSLRSPLCNAERKLRHTSATMSLKSSRWLRSFSSSLASSYLWHSQGKERVLL